MFGLLSHYKIQVSVDGVVKCFLQRGSKNEDIVIKGLFAAKREAKRNQESRDRYSNGQKFLYTLVKMPY